MTQQKTLTEAVFKLLLDSDADLTTKTNTGTTLLYMARIADKGGQSLVGGLLEEVLPPAPKLSSCHFHGRKVFIIETEGWLPE